MLKYLGLDLPTYLTFYPAVMLVSLLLGLWPGLLTTAVAALLAAYWVIPPKGFGIGNAADAAALLIFVTMGATMSLVAELYRRKVTQAVPLHHLAAIIEYSNDAIYSKNLEDTILSWNRGAEKIYGYTAQEMIGRPATRLAALENGEEFSEILERIGRGESVEYYETVRMRKDGQRCEVSETISPMFDAKGGITVTSTVARDISERKRAERRLAEQQFYVRSLIEASLDPLVTISREGKIKDVNRATESATGVPRDRLIGSDFCDYFTEPEKAHAGYRQVFADGLVQDYPLAIRHSSGRLTDVLYNATVFCNQDGEVQGAFATARDVTKQRQAELEAQRYLQELERSNAELQDFASIASHDLQEPLRKVVAFGEHLKEHSGDKLDELGRDFLARMQNAAQRMSVLIEALLQYSRVETRAQPLQAVDTLAVVFGAVSDVGERINRSQARIECTAMPKVIADPVQVRQLIQNLVANALKFQRPGTRPHVVIESRTTDHGDCEISVRDNGIGFEPRYMERIFRPFQRLHGRSEYEGSGMGLAICRKVVARHGGTITAHSAPGEGSTFVVTLPAGKITDGERRELWMTETVPSPSESCSPRTMTTITS
jgi:PAS domain S-box-containing protein